MDTFGYVWIRLDTDRYVWLRPAAFVFFLDFQMAFVGCCIRGIFGYGYILDTHRHFRFSGTLKTLDTVGFSRRCGVFSFECDLDTPLDGRHCLWLAGWARLVVALQRKQAHARAVRCMAWRGYAWTLDTSGFWIRMDFGYVSGFGIRLDTVGYGWIRHLRVSVEI